MLFHSVTTAPSIVVLASIVFANAVLSKSFQARQDLPPRSPPPRQVSLLHNWDPTRIYFTRDGTPVHPSHSALFIAGNGNDGPLKIEIGKYDGRMYVRAFDLERVAPDKTMVSFEHRVVVRVMDTTHTNADFMHPERGEGLIGDAWSKDMIYRNGVENAGKINTCNTFLERLIVDGLGGTIPQTSADYFERSKLWTEQLNYESISEKIDDMRYQFATPKDQPDDIREWKIIRPCAGSKRSRDQACGTKISPSGDDPTKTTAKYAFQNELAVDSAASSLSESELAADDEDTYIRNHFAPDAFKDEKQETRVSLARADGTLKSFTTVGKGALAALGVAGDIVGAAFVILDFVEHNWVGGAIGAVGLAAGIAAGIAVSGPLGWIVGGAIVALFAVLPGLFKDTHSPAARTDIEGIIQWKLFGDKDHTGNGLFSLHTDICTGETDFHGSEQCQKGTSDVPGNQDCQALYGAGTMSLALGMSNFDSVVFLQQFNDGYPIPIKDMAKAFYVVDEDKQGDGSDKIATIQCHNSKGSTGRAGLVGADDPHSCNKPSFSIKREMIHLPHLNTTADNILPRIIPAPNGDCKLIARPGDQSFPSYNTTVTGLPTAVACGLTAAINISGVAVPVNGDTNSQTPHLVSDPHNSTDGSGGAQVAPPPPTPFKSLAEADYVCLAHSTDQPFCLPPGTYERQSGIGFDIKDVNILTLPPGGWTLNTHHRDQPQPDQPQVAQYTNSKYDKNQDPKIKTDEYHRFTKDMDAIDLNFAKEAKFTITGPNDGPDPVCCLFTDPSFSGNVWCIGIGGGDVLPQWNNMAQSVSCHNEGQIWLYAKEYGDAAGALVSGNVEDLNNIPYGPDKDTFSKNVKAIWVSKAQG